MRATTACNSASQTPGRHAFAPMPETLRRRPAAAGHEHPGERVWDLQCMVVRGTPQEPSRQVRPPHALWPVEVSIKTRAETIAERHRRVRHSGSRRYKLARRLPPQRRLRLRLCRQHQAQHLHPGGIPDVVERARPALRRSRRHRHLRRQSNRSLPRAGGPSYYAFAKLAGDADFDVDRMLTDYCTTVYAEAAPQMEQFFQLFHSRSGMTLENSGGHPMRNDRLRFSEGYVVEDTLCALYPPAVIQRMDKLLTRAEATAKSHGPSAG